MAKAQTKEKTEKKPRIKKAKFAGSGMRINVLKTYQFVDKDPIIDKTRTRIQDYAAKRGVTFESAVKELSETCGLTKSAYKGWFEGATRKPQFASLAANARAMGLELDYTDPYGALNNVVSISQARGRLTRRKT